MNYKLLFLFFLIGAVNAFGQEDHQHNGLPCGTDEMHHQLYEKYPEYNAGVVRAYEELKAHTEVFKQQPVNRGGEPYIIPVVFHIIHNYGPENIDDAQIYDAIEQVNTQMRMLNSDTTDIVSEFKGIAADTEIEIRLARKDPDGNCTNGITRTVSSLTAIGDHQVKSLIQWPPDKYLNIYVCDQAAGLAGHAMLPHAADTMPHWDGIVMQGSYVGTIGTSDFFRRTVLTHEIGHYLNLQHIWGGNNVPNYFYLPVAQPENCDYDDEVEDTPLTIGWQSCPLNGSSCGSLDNVQNYMDYAYCARMFTQGQKERMHACLNSPIAGRNNLWTEENLIATGIITEEEELCEVLFKADKDVVCVGQPVIFTDRSYFGVTGRTWNFNGGTATSLSDSIVEVIFNEEGDFAIGLTVEKNGESLSRTEENFIKVIPAQGSWDGIATDFESNTNFQAFWLVENEENPFTWSRTTPGYLSDHSIMLPNFELTAGAAYAFHTYPIDASDLDEIVLSFDLAFARTAPTNNDALMIQISSDCGETWTTRRNLSSLALNSVDGAVEYEEFIPNSESDWKNIMVTTLSNAALVDNLMIRFVFRTGGGNNIYIDNIMIGHPDRLTTENIVKDFGVITYPNPVNDVLTIVGAEALGSHVDFKVYSMTGQAVMSGDFNLSSNKIKEMNVSTLEEGVYLLHLIGEGNRKVVKKMIIK